MTKTLLILALALGATACSKVCEPAPLSGSWKDHADLIPGEATTCAATDTPGNATLQLGFEGKSGPHSFKILRDHLEAAGWKAIRDGGSSMDSFYEKGGKTLQFKVADPKVPLAVLTMPGR
jgi:hypothetical protein